MVGMKVKVSVFVFVSLFIAGFFVLDITSDFSLNKPNITPTQAPTPAADPTLSPAPTPSPNNTPTTTPTPTPTPTNTPTPTPTSTPTSTPTPTPTPTPTSTPTPNPNNTLPTFAPNSSVTPYIIVNTGPSLWQIVQNNQPYENVTAFADALPKGVADSSQLEFWVNTTFVTGGDYHGIGMYLDEVTIIPTKANCFPMFNLQANAHILSPLNVGNQQDPVAGMQVDLEWTIEGPFEHKEGTASYFIQGDGNWKCISQCDMSLSYDPSNDVGPAIFA